MPVGAESKNGSQENRKTNGEEENRKTNGEEESSNSEDESSYCKLFILPIPLLYM